MKGEEFDFPLFLKEEKTINKQHVQAEVHKLL